MRTESHRHIVLRVVDQLSAYYVLVPCNDSRVPLSIWNAKPCGTQFGVFEYSRQASNVRLVALARGLLASAKPIFLVMSVIWD